MSLAIVTSAGILTGAIAVVGRHDQLMKTMTRARLSVQDRADTAKAVRLQLQELGASAADAQVAHEMYQAVLRHEHTLKVAVPPALKDYAILKEAYQEWTEDWVQQAIRALAWNISYYFEDFMDTGPAGTSDAELAMQVMQQAQHEVDQLKHSLELAYPSIRETDSMAVPSTVRETRRARAPSFPI